MPGRESDGSGTCVGTTSEKRDGDERNDETERHGLLLGEREKSITSSNTGGVRNCHLASVLCGFPDLSGRPPRRKAIEVDESRSIAVSPRHTVLLATELYPLVEKPPRQDFVLAPGRGAKPTDCRSWPPSW